MELDRGLQKKKKSHTYIQIIFDKGSKIIQWRKDFPRPEKKSYWVNRKFIWQRMKQDPLLTV